MAFFAISSPLPAQNVPLCKKEQLFFTGGSICSIPAALHGRPDEHSRPTPPAAPKVLKPEEAVRQRVIAQLRQLGWKDSRLQWKPKWPVPATPHDLTKRERGQKFARCGTADLVAFADDSGQPHALQVIFEFKEPIIKAGRQQLQ